MEIRCCPKCGNTNLRQSTYKDGNMFRAYSEPVKYTCNKCLYSGIPIYFNSKEEYKKFIEEIEQK
jgi:hypothetical protein